MGASNSSNQVLTSIKEGRPSSFIISLIQSGCDVNISTETGESPLHLASARRTTKVARALIKSGANLNALNNIRETPLHRAIMNQNREMVDLLLYYGADISIMSNDSYTPLILAAVENNFQIFKTLFRFYNEEYSCITLQNEALIAARLGRTHLNRILLFSNDSFFLRLSMDCGILKLFKLIWNRLDHEKLLDEEKPFLVYYWTSELSFFTTSNWLECLNLILSSPCVYKFVEHYKNYQLRCLPELIRAFDKHGVKRNDRIAVLYTLFAVGVEVCSTDLHWIRLYYGFNEEFEACIYRGNYRGRISHIEECDSPLLTFIFGLEEECSTTRVFELFKDCSPNICHYYKFFSLNSDMKSELLESMDETFDDTAEICQTVAHMNEFPSLLELSRNAAQNWIRKKYEDKIQKPHNFHDVVKGLSLPEDLKDVLLFKRPIYD